MRHHIAEFPVRDAFDPKVGCPFCEMQKLLEERFLTHVLGDAMMDPSIRIQTNQAGFCGAHYQKMLARNNRLSLALIMESHLKHLLKEKHLPTGTAHHHPSARPRLFGRGGAGTPSSKISCYLCERVDGALATMLDTTLRHYEREADFRLLFSAQERICLHHFGQWSALLSLHPPRDQKIRAEVRAESERLCRQGLTVALTDVSAFCKMFDYRNAGGEFGSAREAVERAILTLTGEL